MHPCGKMTECRMCGLVSTIFGKQLQSASIFRFISSFPTTKIIIYFSFCWDQRWTLRSTFQQVDGTVNTVSNNWLNGCHPRQRSREPVCGMPFLTSLVTRNCAMLFPYGITSEAGHGVRPMAPKLKRTKPRSLQIQAGIKP